jgi:hypothetical protein
MLQSCRSPDGWAEVRVTPPLSPFAGLRLSILHDKISRLIQFFLCQGDSKKQFSLFEHGTIKKTNITLHHIKGSYHDQDD